MRDAPYLSENEFSDYIKVGAFAGELRVIAEHTPIKEWAKDLRIASTKLEKVAKARVRCLDNDGLIKAKRKIDHTDLRFVTSDEDRGRKQGLISTPEKKYYVEEEDFVFMVKVLDLAVCKRCNCGDAKNCELRKTYHRIGRIVEDDNPSNGKCEFKVKENE